MASTQKSSGLASFKRQQPRVTTYLEEARSLLFFSLLKTLFYCKLGILLPDLPNNAGINQQ